MGWRQVGEVKWTPAPMAPERLRRRRSPSESFSEAEWAWIRFDQAFNNPGSQPNEGRPCGTLRCRRCGRLLGQVLDIGGVYVLGRRDEAGRYTSFYVMGCHPSVVSSDYEPMLEASEPVGRLWCRQHGERTLGLDGQMVFAREVIANPQRIVSKKV